MGLGCVYDDNNDTDNDSTMTQISRSTRLAACSSGQGLKQGRPPASRSSNSHVGDDDNHDNSTRNARPANSANGIF